MNDYTGWFAGDAEMAGDYFGYDGPFPPFNDSLVHHYVFTLYALTVDRAPVEGAFTGAAGARGDRPRTCSAEATHSGTYTLNRRLLARDAPSADRADDETPTRVIAIRHGETAWNVETRMQGQLDIPLNDARPLAGRASSPTRCADEGIEAIYRATWRARCDTAQRAGARGVGLPRRDRPRPARARLRRVRGLHLRRDRRALARRRGALARAATRRSGPTAARRCASSIARAVATCTRDRRARTPAGRSRWSPTAACSTACTAPPPRVGARGAAHLAARQRGDQPPAAHRQGLMLVGWGDVQHLDAPTIDTREA